MNRLSRISVVSSLLLLLTPALAPVAQAQAHRQNFNVLPMRITGVSVQNGQLVANGLVGSTPFTTPITLTSTPNAADPSCPILDLALAPIHLDLLGLVVDTSAICLDITAVPGSGNLLGNLLCDVANLLNQNVPLTTILSGLTDVQLNLLLTGITQLLNGVLSQLTSANALAGVSGPACNILNLSLGPVNLNLLGLAVSLDNCAGGPVTVDITAIPGTLLGSLLCALANLLNGGANLNAIGALLLQIAGVIAGLL